MRPHPRIRKTVKWGGAVITVLLVALWIGSGWWEARAYLTNGWFGGFGAGRLVIGWITSPNRRTVGIFANAVTDPPILLWWFTSWSGVGFWRIWIPLWIIAAPLAGITALAWRLDTLARRRAKLGVCPKCSYSRTGLAVGGVCPECGSPAPVAAPPG